MTDGIQTNRGGIVARLLVRFLLWMSFAAVNLQQVAAQSDDSATQTAWSELIRRSAAEYKMYRETQDKTPLVFQSKPILRWANNTRLTEDGFTYLWIGQGRPEAVACIFSWGPDRLRHNFQSLSRGPLVVERNGSRVWHPSVPGVEFQRVPEAPTPAESAPARLRQMKAIARDRRAGNRDDAVCRYEAKNR